MTIRRLFNYWLAKKRAGFYMFWGFVFGASYFAGIILRSSELSPLSAYLEGAGLTGFLIDTLAFFIHMNLHSCHWFLGHFQDIDHLPRQQIGMVNSFCMIFFLGLCLIALPGAAWGLEPLWQAIGRWFSGRPDMEQMGYSTLGMEPESAESPGADLSALLGDAKPAPHWILMLDQLLQLLGYVMLAILVFLLIRGLFRSVWRWVTKPRQFDSDEKIYLTPSWSLPSGKKASSEKRSWLQPRSYSQRIRRHYQKKLSSLARKKKVSLPHWASPAELERAAGMEQEILHQIYEKARYGKEECGKEDWEKIYPIKL